MSEIHSVPDTEQSAAHRMQRTTASVLISDHFEHPEPGVPPDVIVVIDVIRAFTTATILFAEGATEVVCTLNLTGAVEVGENAIVVGETEAGTAMPGVIPNSPAVLIGLRDLNDRRIVLFTLNGTRALFRAPACGVLMAAAATNAMATAHWIRANVNGGRVHLVVSDPDGPEDYACAQYIADLVTGQPADSLAAAQEIAKARWAHWDRWGAQVTSEQWLKFEADVNVCSKVDSFPIVMIADVASGLNPILRAVPTPEGGTF